MSVFVRPDSPPPRQPSPDIVHTPLPSPHVSARSRAAKSSVIGPPGLAPPLRTLSQARSYDNLRPDHNVHRLTAALNPADRTLKRRTRSNIEASSNSAPPSLTSNRSGSHHRRTLSVAIPSLSPIQRPTPPSPIPPVPPFPASVTSSPTYKPPGICSEPLALPVTPIYLPDLHELSPISEDTQDHKILFPLALKKQQKGIMTCLKFFTFRNSSSQITRTTKAAQ